MSKEDLFFTDVACDGEPAINPKTADNESAAWEAFIDMELAAREMSHGSIYEHSARLYNYYGDIIASAVFVDGKRIA